MESSEIKACEIIFYHGWSFHGASWNTWHQMSATKFDRGYFFQDSQPVSSNMFPTDRFPKVIVTHSLGLHFVPEEQITRCQKLIIIGGFRSFHEFSDHNRRSKLINKAMQRKMKTAPQEVLHSFYQGCNLQEDLYPDTSKLNVELLMNDLDFLDSAQLDLNLLKEIPSIELLHGATDDIVPIEHAQNLSEQLTNATLQVHPTAGHALPFTCSDWCVQAISTRLNRELVTPGSGIPTA